MTTMLAGGTIGEKADYHSQTLHPALATDSRTPKNLEPLPVIEFFVQHPVL